MSIKFVQTSDWHLGAKLSFLPERTADILRDRALKILGSLIHYVRANEIELLLLPGDIFDNHKPSQKVQQQFLNTINRLEKTTKVFILPGTHDCFSEDSHWNNDRYDHLQIFRSEGYSKFKLDEYGIEVWGVPVGKGKRDINWLESIPELDSSRTNILLYHGDYRGTGREYDKWDYPFELKDILSSKFNYIALGHHHGVNLIESNGRTLAGYSGSPAGWSFRKSETGKRYFLEGIIDSANVCVMKTEIDGFMFRTYDIDVSNVIESENLLQNLEREDENTVLRISLRGQDENGYVEKFEEFTRRFIYMEIIDNRQAIQSIEPSENFHLKKMLETLEEDKKTGQINEEFYNRLVKRAVELFTQ